MVIDNNRTRCRNPKVLTVLWSLEPTIDPTSPMLSPPRSSIIIVFQRQFVSRSSFLLPTCRW